MTSELGGWVVGNIEEFSKKVTSAKTKYRCALESGNDNLVITKEDTLRGFC